MIRPPPRSTLFPYTPLSRSEYNDKATTAAQNLAAERVPVSDGDIVFNPKDTVVPAGEISPRDWQLLRAENDAYRDRKSTRLNSSHLVISYAVFCLKKKKQLS